MGAPPAHDRLDRSRRLLGQSRCPAGTLQYDTYFNADESQCIVLERFVDSDALLLHGQNMAPLMDAIMATASVSGELLGDLSNELAAQMTGSPVGLFTLYQAL